MIQQQQQMAVLQAQVRTMQTAQTVIPMSAPTEHHHHTREIVTNVPTYIAVPLAEATAPVFMGAPMPVGTTLVNQFAEPALQVPEPVFAQDWVAEMTAVAPVAQVATPLELALPGTRVEYRSHQENMDGTWEHNQWWE